MGRIGHSGLILAVMLIVGTGLRLYSLDADPDWRLDWNPGLLTDEAFYMHNARNQVLFGQANLDEFNNAVLSPLVHWLHRWVFAHFGVGYVQGRVVSVVLGLLSIALFWRILWVAFRGAGRPEWAHPYAGMLAALGAAWLAYEHLYLLYNRTALLETPAAFFCLLSLWGFAEAVTSRSRWGMGAWALASGLAGVLALATKLTTLPFVAALLLVALWKASERVVKVALPLGVLVGMALWVGLWLMPHWETWSRMQGFYMRVQGLPHSWAEGWRAVQTALVGERYGLMQFLFLHAPLAWLGSLTVLLGVLRGRALRAALTPVEWVLLLWVALSWLQMIGMRVAPTRYTASFIPAMVALLWVVLARWEHLRPLLTEQDWRSWLVRTLIGAWTLYFLLLLVLPGVEWRTMEFPVLNDALRGQLLLIAGLAAGIVAWRLPFWKLPALTPHRLSLAPAYLIAALGILLNTPWYVSYFGKRTYQLKAFNEALTRLLPDGSVLVGVAFETPFRYFFVFRGLCNDRQPPQALGATHLLVVGSEETLLRFWTSGADLSRWYAVARRVEPAAHPMLRGRVGPYRLLVYPLPRVNELGWRESLLRPRLAPNTLLKPSLDRAISDAYPQRLPRQQDTAP
ncbi:MAG: hypothetical protein ABDI19_07625 [Armatimonadota bacterium]